MNVESVKNAMTQKFGRTGLQLQKYSPQILLGVGLVGGVVAAVMAAKATLKAGDIVDDMRVSLDTIEEVSDNNVLQKKYPKEEVMKAKAQVYVKTGLEFAKLYGPSVGLGVLSISAILGAHGIMVQRQASLVAAYTLLAEGYKNYRDRVVEELGPEKDEQYHLGLREEELTVETVDDEGKKKKTKMKTLVSDRQAPSIYSRFFDAVNPNWTSDRLLNRAFLTSQQNYLNDLLIIRGHVFLNEVYERLGFSVTKEGQLVGWVLREPKEMRDEGRDGYISFGMENPLYDADRQFINLTNDSILLDFNVDGIILNLI